MAVSLGGEGLAPAPGAPGIPLLRGSPPTCGDRAPQQRLPDCLCIRLATSRPHQAGVDRSVPNPNIPSDLHVSVGLPAVTSRSLRRSEQQSLPPLVSTSPLTPLRARHKRARSQPPGPLHPLRPPLLPTHVREAHRRICRERAPFFLLGAGSLPDSRLRRAQRLFFS